MQETDNLKLARALGVLSSNYSMQALAHASAKADRGAQALVGAIDVQRDGIEYLEGMGGGYRIEDHISSRSFKAADFDRIAAAELKRARKAEKRLRAAGVL